MFKWLFLLLATTGRRRARALDDPSTHPGAAAGRPCRDSAGQRRPALVCRVRHRARHAGASVAWRLANSNYWANQIAVLARDHQVIVIDTRGHGRSARNATPLGYEVMATDAVALMDELNIPKAAVIGWSDGAITGLEMAMHHPERVSRLFAFAANSDPSGVKDVHDSPIFTAFIARAGQEYAAMNPTPGGFKAFDAAIEKMWADQPHFSAAALGAITVPVWIADGDHDEAIKRADTDFMAQHIPAAREIILPGVSHFAFLQDPATFTYALGRFLSAP